MLVNLMHFVHDDRGQGLVEYALILAFVAIAAISALRFFGAKTNNIAANNALAPL